MAEFDAWLNGTEQRSEPISASHVTRWCATLDRPEPAEHFAPQGMHWCFCTPDAPTARLGTDGHPARGGAADDFLPPIPLPRRMWAASSVEFVSPLAVGAVLIRQSRIASITPKSGASGSLCFVEVEHTILSGDAVAVRESQSIVYREAAAPASPAAPASAPPPAPAAFDAAQWEAARQITPHETLLFRYSALTFNSHRIHYDRPYATEVEGYRGLVVHGPLIATLLLDLARRELGEQALAAFSFRGVSPATCGEPLWLALRRNSAEYELGAFAEDGRPFMKATARARH